jgi:hypothetical protein
MGKPLPVYLRRMQYSMLVSHVLKVANLLTEQRRV